MQSVFNSVLARWLKWLWRVHWYTAWSTLYSYDTVEQHRHRTSNNYKPEKNTLDLMLVHLQMRKCLNMMNKVSNVVNLDHSCCSFIMNTQRTVVPWEWKSFRGRESPECRQSRPCPDMRENMLNLRWRKKKRFDIQIKLKPSLQWTMWCSRSLSVDLVPSGENICIHSKVYV